MVRFCWGDDAVESIESTGVAPNWHESVRIDTEACRIEMIRLQLVSNRFKLKLKSTRIGLNRPESIASGLTLGGELSRFGLIQIGSARLKSSTRLEAPPIDGPE